MTKLANSFMQTSIIRCIFKEMGMIEKKQWLRYKFLKNLQLQILVWLFLSFTAYTSTGQSLLKGFEVPESKRSIEIPFTYDNGFIVLEIIVQDAFPLRFLFDTGAEYTILAEKAIADLLHFKYHRTFQILGSDMEDTLEAYLARNIKLTMGKLQSKNEDILVLARNVFKFEAFTGTEIHGILGASSFKNMIVQIDYRRERLIFHNSDHFGNKAKKYTSVPIDIKKNKPFLTANFTSGLGITGENVNLLLDTGANIPFLLRKDSSEIAGQMDQLLPGNIASGIGGDLVGYVGRSHALGIEEFEFSGVVTNYQIVKPREDQPNLLLNRNGILGNPILDRFDLILDYVDEKLYLKPNKNYKTKFKYDRSGLQLIAGGSQLSSFSVYNVLPNSPAARAGLKQGDEILSVNGLTTKLMTMAGISIRLQANVGRKMNMKILRNGSVIKKSFRLEDLL